MAARSPPVPLQVRMEERAPSLLGLGADIHGLILDGCESEAVWAMAQVCVPLRRLVRASPNLNERRMAHILRRPLLAWGVRGICRKLNQWNGFLTWQDDADGDVVEGGF